MLRDFEESLVASKKGALVPTVLAVVMAIVAVTVVRALFAIVLGG